ncbi:asparagine synthase-related protein [Nocardia vinacea]|uniref:asparagine synthase (glutamine-hydrolyzing) n=1 Tax=Nocardia vinacea TaxID=96468 RepID=A0ABZ1YH92_9NOCA|nr:asparagine synthase-related protein [Nocardia vinacea]
MSSTARSPLVKGIFASGLVDVTMDPQGLSDCLFYGHTIAPRTFWQGVDDLPPATIVTIDHRGISEQRYFTPFLRRDPDASLLTGRAAIERFDDAFTAAVRKRLPDEVAAGIALSGGLDSSAIAAVATRRCDAPLTTASIRLTGETLDETPMSRLVAQSLGIANDEVEMTAARACELLPKSLWHFESPFWYGAVATPFLDLTEFARNKGLEVAMSGDGSDELLAGYDFHRLMKLSCGGGRGVGGDDRARPSVDHHKAPLPDQCVRPALPALGYRPDLIWVRLPQSRIRENA